MDTWKVRSLPPMEMVFMPFFILLGGFPQPLEGSAMVPQMAVDKMTKIELMNRILRLYCGVTTQWIQTGHEKRDVVIEL